MSGIDHVNVKVFATPDSIVSWPDLIPVFHRWIRERAVPGTLIDVADYSQVPEGPGVLLIAHEAFYSVDNRAGKLGFLYNHRTALPGDGIDKLRQSWSRSVDAAKLLENETAFRGKLRFDYRHFEIFVNDRAVEGEMGPMIDALYRETLDIPPEIQRDHPDPRALVRYNVRPSE